MTFILLDGKPFCFLFAAYLVAVLFDFDIGGGTFLGIANKLSPGYAASNCSIVQSSHDRRRDPKYHTSSHFGSAADESGYF
jgi:hypothetical protein